MTIVYIEPLSITVYDSDDEFDEREEGFPVGDGDSDGERDYAACDKDGCGYCGRCMY